MKTCWASLWVVGMVLFCYWHSLGFMLSIWLFVQNCQCWLSSLLKINQSFSIRGIVSYNNHKNPQIQWYWCALVSPERQPYRDPFLKKTKKTIVPFLEAHRAHVPHHNPFTFHELKDKSCFISAQKFFWHPDVHNSSNRRSLKFALLVL